MINGVSVLKGSGTDLASKTSESVKLKKGANEIVVHYVAPADGDAMIRLSWAGRNKPFDPIPPMVLTHDDDPFLSQQSLIRQGRELFATWRCVKCHAPSETVQTGAGSMPEMSIDAPNLDDVGSRLNPQWMARWIADPKSLRPDATMPRVIARDGARPAESVAADIAAYLATRKSAMARATDSIDLSDTNVVAGERLFLALGCIACHTMPPAKEDANARLVAFCHHEVRAGALREYLKTPEAHFAWTRMPNFHLSDDEAGKVACVSTEGRAWRCAGHGGSERRRCGARQNAL